MRFLCTGAALLILISSGCDHKEPIRIGFVGSLTQRGLDLGVSGRDGALLAVEDANIARKKGEAPLELIVCDAGHDPRQANACIEKLTSGGARIIIGPMTSAMALPMVSAANSKQVPLLSPTASTDRLTEVDDYFFRIYPSSRKTAPILAAHALSRGFRRGAIVRDLSNRAHVDDWAHYFHLGFEEGGGGIVSNLSFDSRDPLADIYSLAQSLRASEAEFVLILACSRGTGLLAQQFRKLGWQPALFGSEWSVTGKIFQFGGQSIEGFTFLHSVNIMDETPEYRQFQDSFSRRFNYPAGFASTHAYDATRIAIQALTGEEKGGTLKDRLRSTRYRGLQSEIRFDDFGDVERPLRLMGIRHQEFSEINSHGFP